MVKDSPKPLDMLAKMCMEAEEEIWEDLGIICGWSSDPKRSTVATNKAAYEYQVKSWLRRNGFTELPPEILKAVCKILTLEGFHSFREVLKEWEIGEEVEGI